MHPTFPEIDECSIDRITPVREKTLILDLSLFRGSVPSAFWKFQQIKPAHQQIWSPSGLSYFFFFKVLFSTPWIWALFDIGFSTLQLKFAYNARCHWLEGACSIRIQTWSWAVTPSAKLNYVRSFPRLLFSLFSLIESEISKQARRKVGTKELNKDL